jgi:hypothetical protein
MRRGAVASSASGVSIDGNATSQIAAAAAAAKIAPGGAVLFLGLDPNLNHGNATGARGYSRCHCLRHGQRLSAIVQLIYPMRHFWTESETHDRHDLRLPGEQLALAEAVVASQPKTAIVLVCAGAVEVTQLLGLSPQVCSSWSASLISTKTAI